MASSQELLVFSGSPSETTVVGALQCEPHTTLRELRQKLVVELGFRLKDEEVLVLSRGTYDETAGGASAGGTAIPGERVPLPLTQNHKLVYPFFSSASHVLVVEVLQARTPDAVRQGVAARALKGERTLHEDLSKGHERLPIPVFNGADDDVSGMDFTCVAAGRSGVDATP